MEAQIFVRDTTGLTSLEKQIVNQISAELFEWDKELRKTDEMIGRIMD